MPTSEMKPEPEKESFPCPRCNSTTTKFCYYNNYNFSQPRHFCKACRRYWTRGGTLRDVPVGGGSRRTAKRLRTAPLCVPTGANAAGFTSMMLNGFNVFPVSGFLFNGGGDTWQGDCFRAFPDLAISSGTLGSTLK